MNTSIPQGCSKLIKRDSKNIYDVTKKWYVKWMHIVEDFNRKKVIKKNILIITCSCHVCILNTQMQRMVQTNALSIISFSSSKPLNESDLWRSPPLPGPH